MTMPGTSFLCWGKRPSRRKNLSRTAKPKRVAPVLFPRRARSSTSKVQCSTNSSVSHCRFMTVSHVYSFHALEPSSESRQSRNSLCLGKYIDEHTSAQLHGKKVRRSEEHTSELQSPVH